MILVAALLMLEASRLKQAVLPLDHPKAHLQRITTSDAAARILDLTSILPDSFIE